MEDEDETEASIDKIMAVDYVSPETSADTDNIYHSTEEEESTESNHTIYNTSNSSYIEDTVSQKRDTPQHSVYSDSSISDDMTYLVENSNNKETAKSMDVDKIDLHQIIKHPMDEDDIYGNNDDINAEYIDIDDLNDDDDDDDNYNYCNDLNCIKVNSFTQSMDKMVDELDEINKWIEMLNKINELDKQQKQLINKHISIELVNNSNWEIRAKNTYKCDGIEIGNLSFSNYPKLSDQDIGIHSNEELRLKFYDQELYADDIRGAEISENFYVLYIIHETRENLDINKSPSPSQHNNNNINNISPLSSPSSPNSYNEPNKFSHYTEFDELDINICQCMSYYKHSENYKYVQYIQQNMRNRESNKKRIVNNPHLIAKLIEMLQTENKKLQMIILDILRFVSYKNPECILMKNELKAISCLIGLIKNTSSHIMRKSLYIIGKISADNASFRDMMLENYILDGMIDIFINDPNYKLLQQIEITLCEICSNYLSEIFTKSYIETKYIPKILKLSSFAINETYHNKIPEEIQKVFAYLRALNENNSIFHGDIIFNASKFVKQYNNTQNNLLFTGFARESIQNILVPMDVYQIYLTYIDIFNIQLEKSIVDLSSDHLYDNSIIEEIGKGLFVQNDDIDTIIKCVKFHGHYYKNASINDIFMNEKAIKRYIEFTGWNNAELRKHATSILLKSGKLSNQELAFKQQYKHNDEDDVMDVFTNKSFNKYPYITYRACIYVFTQRVGHINTSDVWPYKSDLQSMKAAKINGPTPQESTYANALKGSTGRTFNIFVKNLPRGTNKQDLNALFSKFGEIYCCEVSSTKCCGFVNFCTEEAQQKAMNASGSIHMKDNVIECELSNDVTMVYMGNLPLDATKSDIRYHVRMHGERYKSLHIRHGHCFIVYESYYAAERAMQKLQNTNINGSHVWVAIASEAKAKMLSTSMESPAQRSLFIGNLALSVKEQELQDRFCKYGKVISVLIPRRHGNNKPRGFAFIEFENSGDAELAIRGENGNNVHGQNMDIGWSRDPDDVMGGSDNNNNDNNSNNNDNNKPKSDGINNTNQNVLWTLNLLDVNNNNNPWANYNFNGHLGVDLEAEKVLNRIPTNTNISFGIDINNDNDNDNDNQQI